MSRKHMIIMVIILLLTTIIFGAIRLYANYNLKQISGTPTVFVHGYKGTYNSFSNMLIRLEKGEATGKKVLTYHVSKNGDVQIADAELENAEPAFIQVVFENSRANFEESSKWLSSVFKDLKKNHGVNQANVVGHSMGGIVSLKYIEDFQNEEEYPHIDKFVTLGSPFDGIYSEEYFRFNRDAAAVDLKPDSPALELLRKNKQSFPDHIKVLNVGSTGDLIARPESVQSIEEIISKDNLQEVMIENEQLGHSALHENDDVDALVYEFLYGKNNNKSDKTTVDNLQ